MNIYEIEDEKAKEILESPWKQLNMGWNIVGETNILANGKIFMSNIHWDIAMHIIDIHNASLEGF